MVFLQTQTLPGKILNLNSSGAVTVTENAPLAPLVSMGVGGPSRWLITIEDAGAVAPAIAALREAGIPWFVLGGGSNTFFADEGFSGAVLRFGKAFRSIEKGPGEHQLTAGASAVLSAVMNASKRAGLAGFEWAAGVPGVLGGALAGNAGTPAGDACSDVAEVKIIEPETGAERVLRHGDFTFGYRHSSLRDTIILSATYNLRPDEPAAIQARIDSGLAKRRTQPLGQRCSGCMFKNPTGDAAGRLIDKAGLKGLRVGGAVIAQEHANFIVNDGTATAAQIMELVARVKEKVKETAGVELELEIRAMKNQ